MKILVIIAAFLVFCLMIIAHEFGHFITAKLLGVRVNEFSIGMGPLIWQKRRGETQYSIRALPIGGFCALEGEDGGEDPPDGEEPGRAALSAGTGFSTDGAAGPVDPSRRFISKPWWAKIIILAAGAAMNVILCLIILVAVFWHAGSYSPTLSAVTPGYPAEAAGMRAGDTIVSVNGTDYDDWIDIVDAIDASEGHVVFGVLRGGEHLEFDVPLLTVDGRQYAGVQCSLVRSFPLAVRDSFSTCGSYLSSLGEFFVRLFTGRVQSNDVMGVVGMASYVGEQAQYGFAVVLYIMALISFNLGCVNLLPFPALDGGRILFVVIRAVARGRISDEAEARIHAAGMILLLALMVFLIFKDTINLFR